jgi:hypothetical protein
VVLFFAKACKRKYMYYNNSKVKIQNMYIRIKGNELPIASGYAIIAYKVKQKNYYKNIFYFSAI